MSNNKKDIKISTCIILNILIIVLGSINIWCYSSLIYLTEIYTIIAIISTAILIALSILFALTNKSSLLKTAFIIIVVASIFTWGYYSIIALGYQSYLTSDGIRQIVADSGAWGKIVFCFCQFLQVTFIPLPAIVTTIAGTLLFGPATAVLLSFIGIMAGSLFAFWLGDFFGEKLVKWVAGEDKMKKYSNILYDKGKYMFFLMMLFPVFPDDILCLLAGMTTMTWRFFITTILLTRPIGIIMTCYLGSGQIIPYHGWGLLVWAILIILMVLLFWIAYKYKDKIEILINNLNDKIRGVFGKSNSKNTRITPKNKENQNISIEKIENQNKEQE